LDDIEAREAIGRVEGLLAELERLPDRVAREMATETVAALLDLYGEALGRIVTELAVADTDGHLAEVLGDDELVSHVLLLHDLHPSPLEGRVQGALDGVRPYLESHGGNVELLSVDEGIVRLRLEGSCSGCPSSTVTLKLAIEDAIRKAAPDVVSIEAEGVVEEEVPPTNGGTLLQIEGLAPAAPALPEREPQPDWTMAGGMPELTGERPLVKEVSGERICFIRLTGTTYAYHPDCPSCEESLERGSLEATAFVCGGCGNRYDVMRAGRCLDEPQLNLGPIPLLVDESGLVKVALGVPA